MYHSGAQFSTCLCAVGCGKLQMRVYGWEEDGIRMKDVWDKIQIRTCGNVRSGIRAPRLRRCDTRKMTCYL